VTTLDENADRHGYVLLSPMDRGLIFWAERGPQQDAEVEKVRPWVVVSRAIRTFPLVVAVPLTTETEAKTAYAATSKWPPYWKNIAEAEVECFDLAPGSSQRALDKRPRVALAEQLCCMCHGRLNKEPVGRMALEAVNRIANAIAFVVDASFELAVLAARAMHSPGPLVAGAEVATVSDWPRVHSTALRGAVAAVECLRVGGDIACPNVFGPWTCHK
jgi:mRNA-degrading endonuclease toxin of MazEF toxin-antitoxin module